jgi:hypothetical protein
LTIPFAKRPKSATVLGVFQIVEGALGFGFLLFTLGVQVHHGHSPWPHGEKPLSLDFKQNYATVMISDFVFSAISTFSGIALLRGKKWAWYLITSSYLSGIVTSLLHLFLWPELLKSYAPWVPGFSSTAVSMTYLGIATSVIGLLLLFRIDLKAYVNLGSTLVVKDLAIVFTMTAVLALWSSQVSRRNALYFGSKNTSDSTSPNAPLFCSHPTSIDSRCWK